MASVAEQVQQLKREMAEQRRDRAESLRQIRSDVHAVEGTVANMLSQFREARSQDAQVSRQERQEHMRAVRADAQSITGSVAGLLEQFHSERAAATQAESDERMAFVDQVRTRVKTLLSEANEARSEARTQDKAQRQAAMRQIADEVAQLLQESRSVRGHLVDDVRADTKRILEEARAEQSERRAVMQVLHNAWIRAEDAPETPRPQAASEPVSAAVPDASPSEEASTPEEASSEASSSEAAPVSDDYAVPATSGEADAEETATEATETDTQDKGNVPEANGEPKADDSREPDDFAVLQGVGPKIADRLHEAGFITFADLANASPNEIRDRIDELPPFVNVMAWIEQADERTQ